jgi:hypothetical protein
MILLKQAEASGYFNNADNRIALEYEHKFDPLRSREDFKALLTDVMAPPDVSRPATVLQPAVRSR